MHLIVYTSEFSGNNDHIDDVIEKILEKAKKRNVEHGITGLLFYHQGRFLQIIEGSKDSLNDLMTKLESDPRHTNVERLVDEEIKVRSFDNWNMDSFNLSSQEPLDKDELINIGNVYKKTISTRSALLTRFYKAMLASHELRNP